MILQLKYYFTTVYNWEEEILATTCVPQHKAMIENKDVVYIKWSKNHHSREKITPFIRIGKVLKDICGNLKIFISYNHKE